MMAEYGEKVEGSPECREMIGKFVEGSLQRVGTDHFDVLMCPHGAITPEELESRRSPRLRRARKQGKVRFLGVTSHTDPARSFARRRRLGLRRRTGRVQRDQRGLHGKVDPRSSRRGLGVIAMKAAIAVATHHKPLQPVPEWRIDEIDSIVPGEIKPPMKAYLWALQNPHLTTVISNLWDETYVRENLSLAGKKVGSSTPEGAQAAADDTPRPRRSIAIRGSRGLSLSCPEQKGSSSASEHGPLFALRSEPGTHNRRSLPDSPSSTFLAPVTDASASRPSASNERCRCTTYTRAPEPNKSVSGKSSSGSGMRPGARLPTQLFESR